MAIPDEWVIELLTRRSFTRLRSRGPDGACTFAIRVEGCSTVASSKRSSRRGRDRNGVDHVACSRAAVHVRLR